MEWKRATTTNNEEYRFGFFGLAVHVGETEFPLLTGKVRLPRMNNIHHYRKTTSFITQSIFVKERSIVMRMTRRQKMMTYLIKAR